MDPCCPVGVAPSNTAAMAFRTRWKKCNCSKNHVSLDAVRSAVAAFVSGAADPVNPECCPLCFATIIHDAAVHCDTVMDDIKINQQEIFPALFALVGAFPDARVPHIRGCLDAAARRCRETHKYARTDLHCYEQFVERMLFLLFCALEKGSRPVHLNLPWPGNTAAHWPTAMGQLVPLGVDATMDALVYWCCVLPKPELFSLLTNYIRLMPNAVLPALVASPRRERLAWALVTALSASPHTVDWPGGGAPPAGLLRDTSACGGVVLAGCALCVVYAVSEESDRGGAELFALVRRFERAFLAPVIALATARPPLVFPVPHAAGALRPFAHMLHALATHTFVSPLDALPTARLSWTYLNIVDRTFGICSYGPCGRPEVSESGMERFARCGKCRVPRYCGRACQTADWSGGSSVPHKSVCTMLKKLKDQIVSRRNCDWDAYQRIWDDCALAPEDESLLRAWIMASGLLSPVSLIGRS